MSHLAVLALWIAVQLVASELIAVLLWMTELGESHEGERLVGGVLMGCLFGLVGWWLPYLEVGCKVG